MPRNLEQELMASEVIRQGCLNNVYAQNLYAALCNMQWQPIDIWPILKNEVWSCSWRHAGGIIADIRNSLPANPDGSTTEEYIDWYCSGIQPEYKWDSDDAVHDINSTVGYVPEGTVTVVPLIITVSLPVSVVGARVPVTVGQAVFQLVLPTSTQVLYRSLRGVLEV